VQTVLHLGHFFFMLGGVGLLLFGMLDSSFLFLPVGNDLLLAALTASNPHHMFYYVAMATVGSTIGVAFAHFVASRTGKKAIEGDNKSRKVAFVERKVKQYGGLAIALAALAPPGFPFTAFIVASAALQFPLRKMLAIIASCRLMRFLVVGWLARIYGSRIIEMAKSPAFETFLIVLIVVSTAGSIFSIWGWIKKGRTARS
jgi:membrane protein YqaA with SNARE-associated domain